MEALVLAKAKEAVEAVVLAKAKEAVGVEEVEEVEEVEVHPGSTIPV